MSNITVFLSTPLELFDRPEVIEPLTLALKRLLKLVSSVAIRLIAGFN